MRMCKSITKRRQVMKKCVLLVWLVVLCILPNLALAADGSEDTFVYAA